MEMTALWKYVSLIPVHLPIDLTSCFSLGKHCCAIDYILHTVDSATAFKLFNSPSTFPSCYVTAPVPSLQSPYTYFIFSRSRSRPIDTSPSSGVSLHMSTSTIVKNLNKLKLTSPFMPVFGLNRAIRISPNWILVVQTDGYNVSDIADSLGPTF